MNSEDSKPYSGPRGPAGPAGQNWAEHLPVLCHLLALLGWGVPIIGNVVGPLVIWILKRDDLERVDKEGRKSINFQIAVLIASLVLLALGMVPIIGWFLFLPLLVPLHLLNVFFILWASWRTYKGQDYEYPVRKDFMSAIEGIMAAKDR